MPAALRGVLRSEDGVALVLALVTIVVMLLITTALVVATATETLSAQVHEDSGRALNVAEAGAAHAIGYALRGDTNWSDARGATAGNCDYITIEGVKWPVLGDTRPNIPHPCLKNVPYPNTAAVAVQVPPLATGGGGGDVACGTALVNVGTGVGGGTPPPAQQIGTYTVAFHPTQRRSDGTLTLRVTGTVGRATRGVEFLAQRVTPAAFVAYSASTVDAQPTGAGTFRIDGSIYIRGDWSFKGNSRQINNRPVTIDDSPPFENQTFVCNNMTMQGNAQIGEPAQPMRAVHVAGSIHRGGSADIYTNRMTKNVPDVGLGNVERLTRCIRGVPDGTGAAAINQTNCEAEFGPDSRIWNSYTNYARLADGVLRTRWIRHHATGDPWRPGYAPSPLVFGGDTDDRGGRRDDRASPSFALPRGGQEAACLEALADNRPLTANERLRNILAACSLYFDAPNRVIYVAGNQVIYLHGRVEVNVPIRYRVDNDPGAATQTPNDTSVVVVAREERTDPGYSLLLDRIPFLAGLRDEERGSRNLHFARSDLLAFVVNGTTRIAGPGGKPVDCATPSDQEVNAAFITGGDPGTLAVGQGQMIGAIMARRLALDATPAAHNFLLCQVPDMRKLLGPTLVGQFLNDPRHTTVIMQNWREVGF
jgi:hypothetical protein